MSAQWRTRDNALDLSMLKSRLISSKSGVVFLLSLLLRAAQEAGLISAGAVSAH